MMNAFQKTLKRLVLAIMCAGFLNVLSPVIISNPAQAIVCKCGDKYWCSCVDTLAARGAIQAAHAIGEAALLKILQRNFLAYRDKIVGTHHNALGNLNDKEFRGGNNDLFHGVNMVGESLLRFAELMTGTAMQQAFIMGTFFDAQIQLDTERVFQVLRNEAHRDYQPSHGLCEIGTAVRSLSQTEMLSQHRARFLNRHFMDRQLGAAGLAAASSQSRDKKARWDRFRTTYCNPYDNNYNGNMGTGLFPACGTQAGTDRINADIDYSAFDFKRTVDVESTEGVTDILALGANLYGHDVLTRNVNANLLAKENYQTYYMALRSVVARRNVAQNSFDSIVALKAQGPEGMSDSGASSTYSYLAAILADMGVSMEDIAFYIGERPSYYAQLEILAKRIYQNPDFYTDLYDKPANVKRKSVALKAIGLMLDRAIYESELRQEMAASVLLSTKMATTFKAVNSEILNKSTQ